jgi:hypothetical protein
MPVDKITGAHAVFPYGLRYLQPHLPLVHVLSHPDSHARRTRALVPLWLAFAFVVSALVAPAAALDEPYTLSSASTGQHHSPRLPIGFLLTLLFLVGQYAIAFSDTLVGPLMGITSVLWLMMRNDAAIDPRVSWM